MDGLVKAGADIKYVYGQAAKSQHGPLILLAGINDLIKQSPQFIYRNMENELQALSGLRPVCITTIPPRFDVHPDNALHYDIALANNYIRELASKVVNVGVIDFDSFKRNNFTMHGLHLNYKGKLRLAHMIVDFVNRTQGSLQLASSDTVASCASDSKIINTHMADVIKQYKHTKATGFAHSISSDFNDPHHMTAGIAVVFKNNFGKPKPSQCVTSHLVIQEYPNGASMFNLITKERYFGKLIKDDYDTAFKDLTESSKRRRLKHLICSPTD